MFHSPQAVGCASLVAVGKLLKRFQSSRPARGGPVGRAQGEMVKVELVGEAFRRDALEDVRRRYQGRHFEIVLRAEPQNRYDRPGGGCRG
jgi:hypothetical protein